MARFFVDRPVFAWVIALAIALAGLLALRTLPVEQYPEVAPPSLNIHVTYPGADATTLEQTVTAVIEQELNGVEGFLYMSSTSQSNGTATITVTFKSGVNIDVAQMEVQNKLRRVEARLPEEVRRQGIQVNQATSGFLMILALRSPDGSMSALDLGNFATTRVIDEIRRVNGVGDIRLFGSEYAMRIWLDPAKLTAYNMSAAEALAAVREQNSQTAGGQIGDQPTALGTEINATVITQNRFSRPEQFEQIILRANPDGSTVRLADVGRVELGAANYVTTARLNGKPMAGMGIQLASGANALSAAQGVRDRLEELSKGFPPGVEWYVPYDSSSFIRVSLTEVAKTLVEAMILVFLVMYVFLQNWRATIIPTIVVPIALLGSCLGLWLLGFSINVLSLFGMVLAIGILVDDAIVVIENVERVMEEDKVGPYEATVKAVGQIVNAIIGVTLVLVAVFIPMAFFPGSTGAIYRQFSVTLALSIAFSAVLALTLTPALCATLLKPRDAAHGRSLFSRFFDRFNRWFGRTSDRYQGAVARALHAPLRWLASFGVVIGVVLLMFGTLPGGFLPEEDQGYIMTIVQAQPGSTTQRTAEVVEKVEKFYLGQPQTQDVVTILGFSFFGSGQTAAIIFDQLHPWKERKGEESTAQSLVARAYGYFSQIKQAMVFPLNPPAIPALGAAGGFTFKLQDRSAQGPQELLNARNQLLGMAMQNKKLTGVRPEGMEDAPELHVEIDRVKARALGLSISDINNTLSIAFGSAYANDFTRDGRVLRVLLQAEASARMTPQDILDLRVRNAEGQMVPFAAFTTAEWKAGPPQLQRYNGYPAMTISGSAAPGYSSGEAMAEMEQMAAKLPPGFAYEWTGISYEEKQSSGQIGALMALSLLVVFLLLAALYENWSIPLAVLLVVPFGAFGALLAAWARGLPLDVYFNVGLVTIIGLAAKNAILIVEFAKDLEAEGKGVIEATLEAVKLRLRPIIMTSLAFVLGVLPLAISTGAGAASRIAVGTGVMGGMIAATALGIFFTPVFYLSVRRWVSRKNPALKSTDKETSYG